MFDFTQGTQCRGWLFKTKDDLAKLRSHVTKMAKDRLIEGIDMPTPQSFACNINKPGSDVKTVLAQASSYGSAGVKRQRPDSPAPTDIEAVSAEDEEVLLQYFAYMIQDSCDQRSESIKRGLHVQATAITFFKRFFLSNSMLDFDPKVVLMTCMFLAGKVEYEYIKISELKDVFGEKYGKAIIEFESRLLQGLAFNLKNFHPYNPFFGLINGLENVNRVNKLGVSSQDIARLVAWGQESIDVVMPTDLPLLYTPARIALAVLLVSAQKAGLKEKVDEYLIYCFEEEDEYGEMMEEVEKIIPVIEMEMKNAPAKSEGRKNSQVDRWKEAIGKLKKGARWGSKGGEKKGRKKGKTASNAAAVEGAGGGGETT